MRNFLVALIILSFTSRLSAQDTTQHYTLKFSTSNIKVLSDAYLHYAGNFNDILGSFRFDSTLFNQRYNDTCYIKTSLRREFHSSSRKGETGDYYEGREYGYFNAKIVKVNIKKEKFWALDLRSSGKFKTNEERYGFDAITEDLFPVMVFPHIQDKKELREFQRKYEIGDHRIYYDKKTNTFEIELKTSDSFVRKEFFPYYADLDEKDDAQIARLYMEKFQLYTKELFKIEDKFNRSHTKEIAKIYRDQQKLLSKKWKTFQRMFMSAEEKRMSRDQWLEYYKLVIQDEFRAVMNSEPKTGLLDRYLRELGYRWSEMDMVDPNATLVLRGNGSFALISQVTLINLSKMYFVRTNYSHSNQLPLNLSSGDRYAILINTVQGDYGIITTTIQENQEEIELEFKTMQRDLVSIEMVSKKAGL